MEQTTFSRWNEEDWGLMSLVLVFVLLKVVWQSSVKENASSQVEQTEV